MVSMVTILTFKLCFSTLFVIMFEGRGTYFHFCIDFTYLLYFKSSIMLAYDFYLEIQHIFSPYLSKRRYHGNLQFVTLCTVMCK